MVTDLLDLHLSDLVKNATAQAKRKKVNSMCLCLEIRPEEPIIEGQQMWRCPRCGKWEWRDVEEGEQDEDRTDCRD